MEDLEIMLGWECNNNCIFCSNSGLRSKSRAKGMQYVNIKKIDAQLLAKKDRRIDTLIFVGGEPTVIKDFFDIIKLSRERGYNRIFIMTNGRMLSNINFCRKMFRLGVSGIGISIYGHKPEIHDNLTRVPGSFSQTVKGIINLKKINRQFMTNTVITKKNYKYLPDIVKFISKYNPYTILLSFPNPRGNAEKYFNKVVPTYSEVMPYVWEALETAKKIGQKIYTEDIPYCMMEGYEDYMQESHFNKTRTIVTHVTKEIVYTSNTGRDKSKHSSCKACKYNNICEGVWINYLKLNKSEEFKNKTIKSKQI